MNLSTEAANLLNALRSNGFEYTETHADGSVWGSVYLDNVNHGIDNRSIAGYLSALESAGVYKRQDGFFGLVLKGEVVEIESNDFDLGAWEPTGETLDEVIARDMACKRK